eukprot:TRINITY_DN248_c0_g2_i1.p1 TRINITY_DN248_c0_g2~~TRINITY_DN248_c0_g2_i1.p1  ORF type:complete len:126 (+),score=51.33 TRINITY_DN248_c0_g2_i1:52-429(+)
MADPRGEGPVPEASKIDTARLLRIIPDAMDKKLDGNIPKGTQMMAVLKQSPYYPYDPEMGWRHTCSSMNSAYYKCFTKKEYEGWSYHERVAACYDKRADLQVCLVKHKKKERKAQAELEAKMRSG